MTDEQTDYTAEDVERLEEFRDEAAEALSDAQRARDHAPAARGQREFEVKRALERHADNVKALAKAIRNREHSGWDS